MPDFDYFYLTPIIFSLVSFGLGWMCSSVYNFVRTAKYSSFIIKMTYIFYLTMINKGLEYLWYAHSNKLEALRKNGKSYDHPEYISLKKENEKLIETYKSNSIEYLVKTHPKGFEQMLEFHDWKGSQRFLNNHKYSAFMFSKEINK